ncbi:YkgJ family cysteine cluster protein [Marinilabiliaceae bacterium JC017]|nr:YkgJ family cysteine cluster protein [Marinilabiliaceae bacterium JC017]
MANNYLNKYRILREEIDTEVEKLWKEHHTNMQCQKGCDQCCLNFSVFPVEFDAIKEQVHEQYSETFALPTTETTDKCAFLKDHRCTIYEARPIICRTHGLPLLYMDAEGDNWELSHCELNFSKVDETYFHTENTFQQDTFNSELFLLNKAYIKQLEGNSYGEFDLIPLKNLMEE